MQGGMEILSMKFQIVDAFSDELFGGNPAGVVILEKNDDFPDDETMRKTAAELRYSETAFVKQLDEKRFITRYFTPAAEVDLCGHATVGTFYALFERGIIKPGQTYINETLAGNLEILVGKDSVLMDMAEPKIIGEIKERKALEKLYGIMGLSCENQGFYQPDKDIYFIPKIVSTGLPDIMMPVRDEAELEKISPDFGALSKLSEKYAVTGVHAFTCNSADGNIHARNFAPLYEIDEEAATGTSNGALTYYLYDYGLIKQDEINIVIQGEKMGRSSKISTVISVENGKIQIKVGGAAVTLASGEINI